METPPDRHHAGRLSTREWLPDGRIVDVRQQIDGRSTSIRWMLRRSLAVAGFPLPAAALVIAANSCSRFLTLVAH